MNSRALVFAHYDPHGIVDPHVVHFLVCVRQYFDIVCVVSTSDLDAVQLKKLSLIVDKTILRRNIGYDFLSWRVGYEALPRRIQFREVVFANDSCYGPCCDLGNFFRRGEALGVDFWGASINRQFRPHVQSYFMSFGVKLIRSRFLDEFWSSVENIEDKAKLILEYEVGLSAKIEAAGYTIGGVVDLGIPSPELRRRVIGDNVSETDIARSLIATRSIKSDDWPNPVQLYWGESLRRGSPFVKIEVIRDNPLHANVVSIFEYIKNSGWYDVNLIVAHLQRTVGSSQFPPEEGRTNLGVRFRDWLAPT